MTEQRTSAEQRAELRERYAPEPNPTCGHCGGPFKVESSLGFRGLRFERRYERYCINHDCKNSFRSERFNPGDPDVLDAVDDADALAGALVEIARLRTTCGDALAALRAGYRSPHPLDFYLGADPEMHDYVEGRDAARAAKFLDDALACIPGQSDGGK